MRPLPGSLVILLTLLLAVPALAVDDAQPSACDVLRNSMGSAATASSPPPAPAGSDTSGEASYSMTTTTAVAATSVLMVLSLV